MSSASLPGSSYCRTQDLVDQAQQLLRHEWFRDEANGSSPTEHIRVRSGPRGQRDDGNAPGRRIALQSVKDTRPVEPGHVVVEQDQVGTTLRVGSREALFAVGGHEDLMSLGREDIRQDLADHRIIIDHENGEGHRETFVDPITAPHYPRSIDARMLNG